MVRKTALIVKFGQIGDVIMAIPAAYALHERGFEIDWVCGRSVLPLLACYSWIRPILADDRAIFRGSTLKRVRAIAALWGAIARKRYDLCATLYYDRRYHLLTLPVRARSKRMLSRQSRETTLLPGRHHSDEFVRFVLEREDGCQEGSATPVCPDRLPPSPLTPKTAPRRIAIVPGAASNLLHRQVLGMEPESLRRWPVESYRVLAQRLVDRGWEVVLLGGPDESWVKPHFLGIAMTDCIGKLTLPEVVSVCGTCDAVVSNDTGPLHLAGLSETPLVGIFGPTDPSTRIPRRALSVGIWGGQGFACRPCYDGANFAPCQFNGCMHQVTPSRVLRELDRLLDASSRGLPNSWRIAFPDEN
ncbi:heptosyltransferase-2 [Silvibacterium bohemicum]|uniref:Heptosyltransferase-2 n=1 Tax=Silvibacterium bohemicum TaxID=1577686 RepID=A0A841JX08_9BACT|nr:glycosyltransferase family 9 protein [Silvibacterium bohemicum]MBB6145690.1 heptosyltransferase-2 [Silvibacterium bohemicum]